MHSQPGFQAEERSLIRGHIVEEASLDSLKNWYPVILSRQSDDVYWRDMGHTRFTESFFQNSLDAQAHDARRVCKTSTSSLAKIIDTIAPSAFIFHVSRCGSTLLTQMLASLEQCIVLSEPPVIDVFFRNYCIGADFQENQINIFRQLIASLGQKRFQPESHFIIKLDSWHISRIDFIRAAFPDVPLLFLYREPLEVLASHQKQRGPQMVPRFIDLGNLLVDESDLQANDFDGYCLRVLDQYFQIAIRQAAEFPLQLVNYTELPQFVWEKLLFDLGIACTDSQLESLKARALFHSKHPQQNFVEKRKEQVPHTFFSHTASLYNQLEMLRSKQGS
jgi:hypothetical protein